MERLRQSTLAQLSPAVRRPQYDRERLKIAMAHIGAGCCFHRCHQAEFTDDALEAQFGPWGAPALSGWVEAHVAFPSTMVDRIVPASTEADVNYASNAIAALNEAAVVGEPLSQWVIEHSFRGEPPPWERASA
jgi:mannitol-1-phosphate/altronate dehydrogenase